MYILDTDHLSLLERADSREAHQIRYRLDHFLSPSDEIVTTIVTFEEEMRGWMARLAKSKSLSQQVENYQRLNRLLDNYRNIIVLEFDEKSALQFQSLFKARIRIGTMDLKIAAIALAHDATLLSRNLRDFSKVPGLKVEDWSV
jgi:tRNA(fMet)-specific endonuclease VapC